MLVWEHPTTRHVWLGRAVPRAWLAEGEVLRVEGAPTRFGRVGLVLASRVDSEGVLRAALRLVLLSSSGHPCERHAPAGLQRDIASPRARAAASSGSSRMHRLSYIMDVKPRLCCDLRISSSTQELQKHR